ncbi:GTP pyrophosphokinase [Candidatus Desantisbacteria bacterium CG_4_10_14_0_8_um_filter_48_22]|uniref:GTP pyrophosphokinase n=1 Tax=Candidatus Desantisbacteria bacterium CG_4_10_14_0_8_um_filter_48_22 TaxID=1974543 RepID=A0A2M7SEJ2_9BACT|nr:MAG: hypothetical protein AUJ67_04500 [Candidatus Desantisbacteria bacterium CG1_02_49_89]PIV55582.1 MAG: GTP pyrophosphokinase [Candidatus Desantisbacteria bacterium CG02_land_8_20_14_3_00_49_13]PIZ17938.1 MAG: GTP pyrophosphokinase [Candidatus Desantisbacteria bacterium CG_4_10_14_0_8_um_filter_48_22]
MSELIKKAIDLAVEAHKGQKDSRGEEYIEHPFEVMRRMMRDKRPEIELAVAVMHDILEDTPRTEKDIYNAVSACCADKALLVTEALKAITKAKNEDYDEYLERLKGNVIARMVKLYDLEHNIERNLKTFKEDKKSAQRLLKYIRAYDYLGGTNQPYTTS